MTPNQPTTLDDMRQQHDHKFALLAQIRKAERDFLASLEGEKDAPSRDASSHTPGKPSILKKAAAFALSPKQWKSTWDESRAKKVQQHASVYASVAQTFLGVPGIDLSAVAAGLMTLLSPIGQMPTAMQPQHHVSEHTSPAKHINDHTAELYAQVRRRRDEHPEAAFEKSPSIHRAQGGEVGHFDDGGDTSKPTTIKPGAKNKEYSPAYLARIDKLGREILGDNYSPEAIARLAGAPEGSEVSYFPKAGEEALKVNVKHPDIEAMQRTISHVTDYSAANVDAHRKPDGTPDWQNLGKNKIISNDLLVIKDEMQGKGLGLSIFNQQAQAAKEMGFKKIKAYAAGVNYPGSMIGYKTWPKMGYDCPISTLSDELKAKTQAEFPDANTIQDIVDAPADSSGISGQDWWAKHGSSFPAEFDLAEGSRSQKKLAAYAAMKQGASAPSGGIPAAHHKASGGAIGDAKQTTIAATAGEAIIPPESGAPHEVQARVAPEGTDDEPVNVSEGSYVVRRDQAQKPENQEAIAEIAASGGAEDPDNREMLERINAGEDVEEPSQHQHFEHGGSVQDKTKSEAFKRWHGASKVIDETGAPRVVHHGTPSRGIREFDKARIGSVGGGFFGPGFYFSEDEKYADSHTRGTGETLHSYLSIAKPFDMEKRYSPEEAGEITGQKWGMMRRFWRLMTNRRELPTGSELYSTLTDWHGGKKGASEHLKSLGYDGVRAIHSSKPVWVAWEPEQIKATENPGTFDRQNPNMFDDPPGGHSTHRRMGGAVAAHFDKGGMVKDVRPPAMTPDAKKFIKNDAGYQEAIRAYADAPADKKDEFRPKMREAQDAALAVFHQVNVSPEREDSFDLGGDANLQLSSDDQFAQSWDKDVRGDGEKPSAHQRADDDQPAPIAPDPSLPAAGGASSRPSQLRPIPMDAAKPFRFGQGVRMSGMYGGAAKPGEPSPSAGSAYDTSPQPSSRSAHDTSPSADNDVSHRSQSDASAAPQPSAHPDDRLIANRRRMAENSEREAEKYRTLKDATTNVAERREHQARIDRAEKMAAGMREAVSRLQANQDRSGGAAAAPSTIQAPQAPIEQPQPSTHQRAAGAQPATVQAQPAAIPTATFADGGEPIPTAKFAADEAHWTATNQANPFDDHAASRGGEDAPIPAAQLAPEEKEPSKPRRQKKGTWDYSRGPILANLGGKMLHDTANMALKAFGQDEMPYPEHGSPIGGGNSSKGGFDQEDLIRAIEDLAKELRDLRQEMTKSKRDGEKTPGIQKDGSFVPSLKIPGHKTMGGFAENPVTPGNLASAEARRRG